MAIHGTALVHPSAFVEEGATIGPECFVGPFALIGAEVTLHKGVTVKSHAVVTGWTDIGEDTTVFPFACVGEVPQDLKFKGERTRLIVGARCKIREGATLNTGTAGGGGITRVGDDCLLMTGSHVGHDASLGNRVILANQVAIAGHCQIADDVITGVMDVAGIEADAHFFFMLDSAKDLLQLAEGTADFAAFPRHGFQQHGSGLVRRQQGGELGNDHRDSRRFALTDMAAGVKVVEVAG